VVTLSQLRAQDRAVALLLGALDRDRVAHAYLFAGPPGSGKMTAALGLAAALNCEVEPSRGCGSCDICERIASGRHVDVVALERQGAAQIIPIETIRTQIVSRLGIAPHEGKARVFLIEEANAMLGPAANALLKSLEEPPRRTHFVLCTAAPGELLPTLRSRCQRVPFRALPAELRAELNADPAAARRQVEQIEALLAAADQHLEEVFTSSATAAQERSEVAPLLAGVAERLHADALAATRSGQLERAAALSRRAQLALEAEFSVVEHNAHGQLAIEHLLFSMRRHPLPPEAPELDQMGDGEMGEMGPEGIIR
jgi:DNA polymerase-3 subunit delta'